MLPRTFQSGVGRAPSQHCGEGRIADLPPPRACPIFWSFHSRGSSLTEQSSLIPSRTFFSEGPPSLALQASHLAKRDLLEPCSSPGAVSWLPCLPLDTQVMLLDPQCSQPTLGSTSRTQTLSCPGGFAGQVPRSWLGPREGACLQGNYSQCCVILHGELQPVLVAGCWSDSPTSVPRQG